MFRFVSGILLISFWSSWVTSGWYSNSFSPSVFHVPSREPTVTATFPSFLEAEMKYQWVAFRSRFLDLRIARKSKKNVTVRTKQRGFDEFTYLLDLSNCIRISISKSIPIEIVACTFVPFFDNLSRTSCMQKGLLVIMFFPSTYNFGFHLT